MRLRRASSTPRSVKVFFALTFVVFTCVFPYIGGINNPDENVRVFMTMAIVEHHTFQIDKIVERQGWVNDMARAPARTPDGAGESHYFSIKGPATGYLGVPFYWAFTKIAPRFGHPVPTVESPPAERIWWMGATVIVLRIFVVQLPCFAFLVWFERWLRRTSDDPVLRLSAVAAAGLGTNFLAYSLMFVSHTLFAVAAFPAFAIITSERLRFHDVPRQRRLSRAFLAGFLAGFATLLEYHAFPISCLLALYALTAFWRPTRLLAFASGALLNAGALMFYQWRCYGNPLTPGHKMAESAVFAAYHNQGFFGLGAPSFDVFKNLSLSHSYGFFGTSPFMWLGLVAIPFGGLFFAFGTRVERRHRRVATIVWLVMMFTLWFSISCAVNWRGGWVVGPRFFGAAPPFFAFGALCALEWIARRGRFARALARGVAGGLAIASAAQIGFVALVFNTYPEDVTRALPQVALPLARAGFVPHHAGELFGITSYVVWWMVAGCLGLAVLVAALWPSGERWWTMTTRVLVVAVACVLGTLPAFSEPTPEEAGDKGASARHWLAQVWEPPGRDRITVLREQAERFGPRGPCLWYKLADLERGLDFVAEADRDEKRASVPRDQCR